MSENFTINLDHIETLEKLIIEAGDYAQKNLNRLLDSQDESTISEAEDVLSRIEIIMHFYQLHMGKRPLKKISNFAPYSSPSQHDIKIIN